MRMWIIRNCFLKVSNTGMLLALLTMIILQTVLSMKTVRRMSSAPLLLKTSVWMLAHWMCVGCRQFVQQLYTGQCALVRMALMEMLMINVLR